MAYLYSR